jgi:Spy/CpxP family protein refolding chaperone
MGAASAQPMGGGPGMYGGGPGMTGGPAMHMGMDGGGPGGRHFGRGGAGMFGPALDAAGATPEQRAKVQEIMKAARTDMQQQLPAGRALREEMARLMTAPTLDAAAVEATRQRMLVHHDGVSRRMTQAMLDASAVLTPEQRQKVQSYLTSRRDLMERHRRERDALWPQRGALALGLARGASRPARRANRDNRAARRHGPGGAACP